MKNLDWDKIPSFDQLPAKAGAPPESSWGVFGDDDPFGCLNFLTPQGVVDAAQLVQNGKVFRLDAKIGFAKPALFGRAGVSHQVLALAPFANDDLLNNYNTQEGSQSDGFAHVGHAGLKSYYNGVGASEIGPGGKLSIHEWAGRFVGRGALVDVFGYCKSKGRDVHPMEREVYTLADLKGALEHQGTTLKPGTILLIRTGSMETYEQSTPEQKQRFSSIENVRVGRDTGRPGNDRVAMGSARRCNRDRLSGRRAVCPSISPVRIFGIIGLFLCSGFPSANYLFSLR